MRLDPKSFVILLTFILGAFGLQNNGIFRVADATYVEGLITEDTFWTLVDSPFVVSNDVTVHPNATLTIEPGVEVRFGGDFSLTVLGRLYANGTEKTIRFTSNRQRPNTGDWESVEFRGLEQSTLIGCSVTYAANGILIDNGRLRIQASTVRYCSQNGIYSTDSELTIVDSLITDNGDNGITITGDRPVTIHGNAIISNKHGISVTGSEASNIEIIQNVVSANEQTGIEIDATIHTNLVITHNNVSSNYKGLFILSPTETSITDNSISYNQIGVLYGNGNHTIHFNDVYGNDLGMDVEAGATVNAEHNYWGDESGPYHETLNPQGRGDPVGGRGFNLDFVFFLTEPIGHINIRPVAILLTDRTSVPPNQNIIFYGTNSLDEGRVDRYHFDFGDGNISSWTTLSTLNHQYPSTGVYTASLTVMDDFGVASVNNATITINVEDLPPLQVSMNVDQLRVYEREQVPVTVHVMNETVGIENAYVTLFSLNGGNFTDSFGYTDSSGYFTTIFTAPDVTYITNVRIVARASKTEYTDGSDYEDLESLPSLSVQVVSDSYLRTEKSTQVDVIVKSNEQPVEEAAVSLSTDYGYISTSTGTTDSDGIFSTYFTAPETIEYLDVTIVATVIKEGHMNGMGQKVITIEPKLLTVYATAEPSVGTSEAPIDVSVQVEYDMIPILDANVTIVLESSKATGLTDVSGDVRLTIMAPPVNTLSNITLLVKARKDGYADGETQLEIPVNPGELEVKIEVSQSMIDSGDSTVVTLKVTCNGTPVEAASIVVSSTHGRFRNSQNTTNSDGSCEFVFEAPRTPTQLTTTVTANATKNGYLNEIDQTTITVTPEAAETSGGLPLMTILLILIPVVIVVVVVVLIKSGVINFSVEEED